MLPAASRKRPRAGDGIHGLPRSLDWWDERDNETNDGSLEDEEEERRAMSPPPVNADMLTYTNAGPVHKRRHVEHEIGGSLHNMTLYEPWTNDVPEAEMTGASYEIAPDRIYVHSLDDDSEEDEESEPGMWHVNPYAAQKFGDAIQTPRTSVPPWLATAQEKAIFREPESRNSLVLWQPPVWQQTNDTVNETAEPAEPSMDLEEV